MEFCQLIKESGAELMEMKVIGTGKGLLIEELDPALEWSCSALMHH